jgi:hypothetical protein
MHTLEKFEGTFAISDHNRIPEVLVEYLTERFYDKVDNKWVANRKHQLGNISMETINEALNEVWEGPGSVDTIRAYIAESRGARLSSMIESQPKAKTPVPVSTVDSNLKVQDD